MYNFNKTLNKPKEQTPDTNFHGHNSLFSSIRSNVYCLWASFALACSSGCSQVLHMVSLKAVGKWVVWQGTAGPSAPPWAHPLTVSAVGSQALLQHPSRAAWKHLQLLPGVRKPGWAGSWGAAVLGDAGGCSAVLGDADGCSAGGQAFSRNPPAPGCSRCGRCELDE